jgi:hypothetical protein
MAKLGPTSERRLADCAPDLRRLVAEVVRRLPAAYDITVVTGHRGEAAQNLAFERGHSKLQWPDSAHNTLPAKAVDLAPYPTDWNDEPAFAWLHGFASAVAKDLGIRIRRPLTWDYAHVELEP